MFKKLLKKSNLGDIHGTLTTDNVNLKVEVNRKIAREIEEGLRECRMRRLMDSGTLEIVKKIG